MPTCKQCNKNFPTRKKIDGKVVYLNRRSYCLECSPYMEKNGYNLRKQNTRSVEKSGKICPCCERQQKTYNKNSVCSTCRSSYTRYIKKNKLKQLSGGCCVICGNNNIDILHFHHKDPETKLFDLSSSYHNTNYQLLKDECNKCELLCPNCHAEKHVKCNQKVIDYYNLDDRT